jgi:tripartite-type tricarboxylate transporter receptor subunit TctC
VWPSFETARAKKARASSGRGKLREARITRLSGEQMVEIKLVRGLALRSAVAAGALLLVASLLILPGREARAATSELKVVVGFAAGSGVDSIARIVAERVRIVSGRAVIVENRPGGSGRIAAEAVVRAEPDGSTILFAPIVTTAFTPRTRALIP